MKIAVVGLGAVGGLIAGRLARAGCAVSGVARGATLARSSATACRSASTARSGKRRSPPAPTRATLGPQDLVVLALKGPA
jgi:2-dehydropantoate 2-reductase